MNIESAWIDTRRAAIYAGLRSKNGYRTLNRWIRRGLVPSKFVGGDHNLVVKLEGIDIALRRLRERRMKRCGMR